jgi:hypothetical protein
MMEGTTSMMMSMEKMMCVGNEVYEDDDEQHDANECKHG